MNKSTTTKANTNTPDQANRIKSVNEVRLIGRLTADPVVRDTNSGQVATLRLATNNTHVAEFHNAVLWDWHAGDLVQEFTKGQAVEICGRLRTRTWTGADGHTRRNTEIVITSVMPLTAA